MLDLAIKGTSSNEMVQAANLTQLVNRYFGIQCWPWEVEDIPEEWLHFIIAMSSDLPTMTAGVNKIKKIKDAIIAQHPTYRPIKRH